MGELERSWPALAGGVTAITLLAWLAWQAGGYFPSSHLTAGAVAFAALALLLALRPERQPIPRAGMLALGALIAFAAWTGLSRGWSATPDVALEDMQRTLVYAALFGLVLVALGTGRHAKRIPWAVLALVTVVCGAGLISRVLPSVISAAGTVSVFDDHRLAYPLTYWNSFGVMGVVGVLLGAGLSAEPRVSPAARGLAASAAVACGLAAYLSFSRGAWLAFFAGLVVLLAMSAHRWQLLASLLAVGAALAAALLALRGHPGLTDAPDLGAGQAEEGRDWAPVALAAVVAAGAARAALAMVRGPSFSRDRLRALARPLWIGALGLLAIAALGTYAVAGDEIEGESAQRVADVEDWADRQWRDFVTPAGFSAQGVERLTTTRGTRADLYRVAFDGFQADPLRGDGSGSFEVRFARDRAVREKARDAHSLILETLGELGLVGAALLLVFLGTLVFAAVRARLRPSVLPRTHAAAVGAALAAWMFHAAVDWAWQMPALTGTVLVLAACTFPRGRERRRRERRRRGTGAPPEGERREGDRRLTYRTSKGRPAS